MGTTWSALFFVAGFGLLTVFWDLSARRIAGSGGWGSGVIIKDGIPAFLSIVPGAALMYVSAWAGWFQSKDAYFRRWADTSPWSWLVMGRPTSFFYESPKDRSPSATFLAAPRPSSRWAIP